MTKTCKLVAKNADHKLTVTIRVESHDGLLMRDEINNVARQMLRGCVNHLPALPYVDLGPENIRVEGVSRP